MPGKIQYLSTKSIAHLGRMLHKSRSTPEDVGPYPYEQDLHSPDVYIAQTPQGGLDGLAVDIETGTGTGTGSDMYRPGVADCAIYRILEDADGPYLYAVPGLYRPVHNLGATISGGTWVVVERDKFGSWVVQPNRESTVARVLCLYRTDGYRVDVSNTCDDCTGTGTGRGTGTGDDLEPRTGRRCETLLYIGMIQNYDADCDVWIDGECVVLADIMGRPLMPGNHYTAFSNGVLPRTIQATPIPVDTPCADVADDYRQPILYWTDGGGASVMLRVTADLGLLCEDCGDGTGTGTGTGTGGGEGGGEDPWWCVPNVFPDPPGSHCEQSASDPGGGAIGPYATQMDCESECGGILSTRVSIDGRSLALKSRNSFSISKYYDESDYRELGDCGDPVYNLYLAEIIRFNHSTCLWEVVSPGDKPVLVVEKRGRPLTVTVHYPADFHSVVPVYEAEQSLCLPGTGTDYCTSYDCRPLYMVSCEGYTGELVIPADTRCELVEDTYDKVGTGAGSTAYRRLQRLYKYTIVVACGDIACIRGPEFWHNVGCCECEEGAVDDEEDYGDGGEDCCGGALPAGVWATITNGGSLNGSYWAPKTSSGGCTAFITTFTACNCSWSIILRCNCGSNEDKDWSVSLSPSLPCTWTCDVGPTVGAVTNCRPFFGRFTFAFKCNCGGDCTCAEDFTNVVIEFTE